MRRVNDEGLRLLRRWEGLRLAAYPDPATGGEPWTIGYGHTRGVTPGMRLTLAEAERLLVEDLDLFERGVQELVTVPLSDNEFSALVVLAFNIGLEAFGRSTLVRRLNAGLPCADEFLRWNKAGAPPRAMKGLTARRFAERALFLTKPVMRGRHA